MERFNKETFESGLQSFVQKPREVTIVRFDGTQEHAFMIFDWLITKLGLELKDAMYTQEWNKPNRLTFSFGFEGFRVERNEFIGIDLKHNRPIFFRGRNHIEEDFTAK